MVSGTFYINSPEYNQKVKPYPYDPVYALSLLKSAGWEDHDGDGILDKDRTPFAFEFTFPAGNKIAEQLATIMQENLKAVGIRMEIRKFEWAVFLQRIDARNFDAMHLGLESGLGKRSVSVVALIHGREGIELCRVQKRGGRSHH